LVHPGFRHIYWLNISAVLVDPQNTTWGWKSTLDRWNDDAVWATWGNLNWIDMWEPAPPLMNTFNITVDPIGNFMGGGGGGAYGMGVFLPDGNWWNIWFYDHPFAPSDARRALSNSTCSRSLRADVPRPGRELVDRSVVDRAAATRQRAADSACDELRYIGRDSLITIMQPGHYRLPYVIPMYNPEWVSVDVRGNNFMIENGTIIHECQPSLNCRS